MVRRLKESEKKELEEREREFLNAYYAWVATRPLVDRLDGDVSQDDYAIRNHAWERYVDARKRLSLYHEALVS